MKMAIMNRERIERMARKPFPDRTAVISITDSDASPVEFQHEPEFLLPMVFDDMAPESDFLNDLFKEFPGELDKYQLLTDGQAAEIAFFARIMHASADLMICQCEFGQSRSAAVAAAIMEHFGRNGIDVFADDRYFPNKYVFRKVLEALRKTE